MLSAALFLCTVASVTDGDTFRCADGTRVALHAVDAPALGGCRRSEECAEVDPRKAKAALTRITFGKTLRCERTGQSKGLVTAWCRVAGADVSCAMYRGGWAVRIAAVDRPRRLCRHRRLVPVDLVPGYRG
jgi:endonuclease YncB( thermonuclease family)